MDVVEAIAQRKSIRAFKTDPVPMDTLKAILTQALRAPSWANTQAWEFAIAAGQTVEEIRKAYMEKAQAGEMMNPDIAAPKGYPEPYDTRRRGVGQKLFDVMGIPREDKEQRIRWGLEGLRMFGAPNVIFIQIDRSFHFQEDSVNMWPLFDCGLVAQNIMLLALKFGLGTVPEIQAVAYPDILKKIMGIPDSKLMVLGIAIGYPDWDHKANQIQTDREPLDGIASWYGF